MATQRPNRTRALSRTLLLSMAALAPATLASTAKADFLDWLLVSLEGDWSNPLFWEDQDVPSFGDIAIFPNYGQAYECTVDVDTATLGVLMQDPASTLRIAGTTMTVLDDPNNVHGHFAIAAGTVDMQSATIFVDDSVDGFGTIDNDGTIVAGGDSTIDVPIILNDGTLRIEGRPGLNTNVTIVNPWFNSGLFELDSVSNGYALLTPDSGDVHNNPSGEVRFTGGGSQVNRYFRANLSSDGTVTIGTGVLANFDQPDRVAEFSGGALLIEPGGTLRNASAANEFIVSGAKVVNDGAFEVTGPGRLEVTGGNISGLPPRVTNGTLSFGDGSTASGPLELNGGNVVEGDVPGGIVLAISGESGVNTSATFDAAATNHGELQLLSVGNGYALMNNDDFLNLGTMRIQDGGGSQPLRYVRTNLVNEGLFVAEPVAATRFDEAGRTFENHGTVVIEAGGEIYGSGGTIMRHASGLLDVQGTLDWTGGAFEWLGGDIAGTPIIGTSLSVVFGPGAQSAGEVHMDGTCSFSGDVTEPQTVRIFGRSGVNSSATLMQDMQLAGTLELASEGNGYALVHPDTIAAIDITPTGKLHLMAGGSQWLRYVRNDVTNAGTIEIDSNALGRFDAGRVVTTSGVVSVAVDGELTNGGAGGVFRLEGGSLDVAGLFHWLGGTVELAGGTHTGVPLEIVNGTIAIPAGAEPTATLNTSGSGTVFGDVPANVDLLVEGRPGLNSSLDVGLGMVNDGGIELGSTGNGYALIQAPDGTDEFVNRGLFVASAGGSSPWRYVYTSVTNEGTIEVEPTALFRQDGETVYNTGLVRIHGEMDSSPATPFFFNEPGGRVEGDGMFGGGYLTVLNEGTVAPGDGVTQLTIAGDFEQTASGTLEIEVDDLAADVLVIDGTAFLAGALDVDVLEAAPIGTVLTVINAAGGVVGTFDSVPGGYAIEYLTTSVELTVTSVPVTGDVNGDGVVDTTDLIAVITDWGVCGGCPSDLDGNGFVDVSDLVLVLTNWT